MGQVSEGHGGFVMCCPAALDACSHTAAEPFVPLLLVTLLLVTLLMVTLLLVTFLLVNLLLVTLLLVTLLLVTLLLVTLLLVTRPHTPLRTPPELSLRRS